MITEIVLALVNLVTGVYCATQVQGFQAAFIRFGDDNLGYYNAIYFGGIGQAAYGSLLILVGICTIFFSPRRWSHRNLQLRHNGGNVET